MPRRRALRTRRTAEVNRSAARAARSLRRLVQIMAALRSPRGCPWDRRQTPRSLRPYLIEEAYEAVDAIDQGDARALCGELGDVLLQCVFHAEIAAERGAFELSDAIDAIVSKLIRRHPHVFTAGGRLLSSSARARANVRSPRQVRERWEVLKAQEQAGAGAPRRLLAGVPRSMPGLLRAHKIGARAATVGFDWASAPDVIAKIDEEVRELGAAIAQGGADAFEEMGDVLFSLANLSRKLGIEPEGALRAANDKFTRRFDAVERLLEQEGTDVHRAAPDRLERAWQRVKQDPTAVA